jgi:hypothetical protein
MSEKLSFLIRKTDGAKGIASLLPLLDVAVVIIVKTDRVLAVFNDRWGAFTLPMSKRRSWHGPSGEKAVREESWEEAALRAATEWTCCTTRELPEPMLDMAEFQQSDRDGQWKRYHLQVFAMTVGEDFALPAGKTAEWLLPDEILDEERRPISPTARHIVAELRLEGRL